ncbi:ABC transporter permease [Lichenihabitans sp. Uapishka_5]|uniref:ABC transporter permease n=1 Tax=Lichenihabitans sp. Uapishka_5 TaxID=3037302 RepID=UPI0029E7FD46|nr:ABC transporter permease [Lichenihabitans sp. Uapishka_5]MDX7951042.1 ABC transporter permease [Lichenihabitans sp. Uapishka_5]
MTALRALLRHPEAVIAAVLVAAMIGIGLVNPAFWSLDNLFGLLRSNIITGIMALGVLMVMITGGIDVSFPAFAVAAMYLVVGWMADTGSINLVLAFAAATGIGLALGACNALFIRSFRMIPLIVTLGTASVVRGLLLGLVGTSVININRMPPALIDFGRHDIVSITNPDGTRFGLTAMILIYAGLALGVHLLLRHTVIGRGLYAYGGSPEAASRVGFDTRKILALAYCGAGALAGFAGLLHASMIWLANPRDFVGLELDVIAAVVLGGASIFGGRGSVIGTVLGVFLLVMIKNSLILMHVDTTWQQVVVGLVIVGSTTLTALRDRKRLA